MDGERDAPSISMHRHTGMSHLYPCHGHGNMPEDKRLDARGDDCMRESKYVLPSLRVRSASAMGSFCLRNKFTSSLPQVYPLNGEWTFSDRIQSIATATLVGRRRHKTVCAQHQFLRCLSTMLLYSAEKLHMPLFCCTFADR